MLLIQTKVTLHVDFALLYGIVSGIHSNYTASTVVRLWELGLQNWNASGKLTGIEIHLSFC